MSKEKQPSRCKYTIFVEMSVMSPSLYDIILRKEFYIYSLL